ncbi:hypothetical protein [Chitinophaga sancti]|uniref:Uncharacterized protein n=1 Tax=Chitinophaga sancti TaxID=1004 RepID=A0A1K1S718_9BACT|nr:hypothetical protein [Chitinophaga sancti]WQD62187.1 hypothetical protein U0033_30315 [Chitinophaga sancti]WQG92244.1 hypothetical protein SR876_12070 [Chitinophaga sancti]SFW80010.1 hypothetical protein SAMN05661012_04883 [Chitinophaga sancti]
MIAYNKQQLDNREINLEAEKAFRKQLITQEELNSIKAAYPVELYTPNMYLRIGLFILSLIIGIFSYGFLCLIMLSGANENVFGGINIFFAIASYIVLELLVKDKKHYKSGADAALMWMSGAALIAGVVAFDTHMDPVAIGIIVFIVSMWFFIRFADQVMGWVAQLALLFTLLTGLMSWLLVVPFVIIGASFGMYWLLRSLVILEECRYYKGVMKGMQALALLTLYAGGNYFLVRDTYESWNNIPGMYVKGLPMGWLFWALTVLVPLIYLFFGLKNKDQILVRVGLVLVAAIVFTVRYYHSVAPLEVAMTVGGLIMILFAYSIIKYLKAPKHGFTSEEDDEKGTLEALQIESILISQSFKTGAPGKDRFDFGGGTGSGGGASGQY